MLIKSDLSADIGQENIILSENEVFASSIKALKRAREIVSCGERKDLPGCI